MACAGTYFPFRCARRHHRLQFPSIRLWEHRMRMEHSNDGIGEQKCYWHLFHGSAVSDRFIVGAHRKWKSLEFIYENNHAIYCQWKLVRSGDGFFFLFFHFFYFKNSFYGRSERCAWQKHNNIFSSASRVEDIETIDWDVRFTVTDKILLQNFSLLGAQFRVSLQSR